MIIELMVIVLVILLFIGVVASLILEKVCWLIAIVWFPLMGWTASYFFTEEKIEKEVIVKIKEDLDSQYILYEEGDELKVKNLNVHFRKVLPKDAEIKIVYYKHGFYNGFYRLSNKIKFIIMEKQ